MKSLAVSFFIRKRIATTEAKAKELRPFVEKLLTRAKNPTLANRRIIRESFSETITARIIERAGEMGDRAGGYTRIMKQGVRKSDSARMAIIEMIG